MGCGYSVGVGADVTVNANSTKTVLGVLSGSAFGLKLKKVSVGSRGSGSTAPTAVPLLVEVCYCTFATNPPGTSSTSETPAQTYGRVIASGVTAASDWSAEPTVLTVLDEFALHVQQMMKEGLPLADEYDSDVSDGFAIRISNPTGNPNVPLRPMMHWERI